MIYVMRNPKDVLVSSYYFHQMASFLQDPGTFDEFMTTFLEGKGRIFNPCACFSFFCQWAVKVQQWLVVCLTHSMLVSSSVLFGKWTDHVRSWRHTDLGDRIMYITYEEMVQVKLIEAELSTF